jgi:signal transduction histidine kinase
MKHQFLLIFLVCHSILFSQTTFQEEVRMLDSKHTNGKLSDTAYVNAANNLAWVFRNSPTDSTIAWQLKTIALSRKIGYRKGEAEGTRLLANSYENMRLYDAALRSYDKVLEMASDAGMEDVKCRVLNNIGGLNTHLGNYLVAEQRFYESLRLAEAIGDKIMLGTVLNNLATLFFFRGQYDQAEDFYIKTLDIAIESQDSIGIGASYNNLGELFIVEKKWPEALRQLELAEAIGKRINFRDITLFSTVNLAKVHFELGDSKKAITLFYDAIELAKTAGDSYHEANAVLGLATVKFRLGGFDEAAELAEKGTQISTAIGQNQLTRDGHFLLADIYETTGNSNLALKNFRLYKVFADSLNNIESERASAKLQAEYEYSKKELQLQRKNLHLRWIIFSFFAGFVSLAVIAFIVNRNRAKIKLANDQLNLKNAKIEEQKASLEKAITDLKLTQNQLIQSEKLASLGELTAGIAHEIQNPLNFVNNFSEVSKELLDEMKQAMEKGDTEDAKEIMNDVIQNLEKINHHGKRADGIVKGMLQHSRSSTSQKESTDINALCDEYLRLAYHGLKAKDNNFNATMETHFDPNLPKIDVIPQDIGRVLLNLINNAFYAVNERSKIGEAGYQPKVSVTTQLKANGQLLISVEDNGPGIPEAIRDKIFQPFYTTKPTGQGTGLGLSLSYDIVKAHGGQIIAKSKEYEGTTFNIELHA